MAEKKRNTTRVVFHTLAEIRDNRAVIKGKVEDLSLKGMLLITRERSPQIEVESSVLITIHLNGTGSKLSFGLEGKVARIDETGIGIKFTTMEYDSFIYLRNIVEYNTGDSEKIMKEFYETIDLIP